MKAGKVMNIPFSPPDITQEEINEVTDALKSGWITTGGRTKAFEDKIAKYIGVSKAVCLNSATAAMEMTLRILGIGKGDEVITTAYTYTATASVIEHIGAKIVLADIDENSFEIDYNRIENLITERTKVIIPVDIGGRLCDYDRVFKAVENKKQLFKPSNDIQKAFNRVIVMADSAHGFGGKKYGKTSGQFADFTCFSFHAVKNLTTGEGGAVVWKDINGIDNEWLYKQYMLISLHGQSKDAFSKMGLGAWEYDIVSTAYKCNMTDIAAAIGIKQLDRYDSMLERRKEIIKRYDEAFLPLGLKSLVHYDDENESSGHLYLLCIPDITEQQRNDIIIKLAEHGIAANVHYKPLPMLTAYKNLGFDIKDYPNAYNRYKSEISLPLNTVITDEEVEYIIDNIKKRISV